MDKNTFINIHKCAVSDGRKNFIENLEWVYKDGENWLITGSNGGGKSAMASALSGNLEIVPDNFAEGSFYTNIFKNSTVSVSFEKAAALIEEEMANDESEFVEGGVDIGRTAGAFIASALPPAEKDCNLAEHPAVKLLGIGHILNRGLKYLSTGEIRRTLLAQALAAKSDLLILDEPFEGLDVQSRENLRNFLAGLLQNDKNSAGSADKNAPDVHIPKILLLMDRFDYVPDSITHVLELYKGSVSFCGKVADYADFLKARQESEKEAKEQMKAELVHAVAEAQKQGILQKEAIEAGSSLPLIEMNNVCVGWDGKKVLDNLNWKVESGKHWLIRGPNGSGKTTLLELITGDNAQVFCNDVRLFGNKRGSGETIWELKAKMGIVSYRLHVDYRNFGDMKIENIVISGLHDSIGLYEKVGDYEKILARSWLKLCGFENRYDEAFKTLSYGEQRGVLIARAVVKCPKLLILDEPCHGLDSESKTRVLSILQTIADSGLTTLLHVTHDPDEVLPCEKQVLELRPGETPMYQILER